MGVEYLNLDKPILIQIIENILEIMPHFFLFFWTHFSIAHRMTRIHKPISISVSFTLINIEINVVLNIEQAKLVDEDVCCFDESTNELIRLVFNKFKVFEDVSLHNRVNAEQVTVEHNFDVVQVKLVAALRRWTLL